MRRRYVSACASPDLGCVAIIDPYGNARVHWMSDQPMVGEEDRVIYGSTIAGLCRFLEAHGQNITHVAFDQREVVRLPTPKPARGSSPMADALAKALGQ